MGLAMAKLMLGKIIVETPKHEVLRTGAGYEIRKYPPCVLAEVTYDPKDMKGDRDGGFQLLAKYIGVFGKPQNTKPEKIASGGEPEEIAMTAPVITSSGGAKPEAIAMTVPVITSSEPEPVAMTAPVITAEGREEQAGKVTMQFLLPSKYGKAEEAPRPTDERVVLREVGERKYGVVRFGGLTGDKVVAEKVEGLKAALEKDGHTITGPFVLSRYNPPWTLPPLRTNEVMIPVE
ncbi:heme-binding-like protein At3g10130, chloroplastic [Lolium rigidum]|uniref:heme-binding-like protein At3g10130, chloroplastic n=1 Tax=Lolium rigidum TaxID=89674 RepID=UPI001F5CDDB5|nr:heme-binding-like protein At3g10130, chloroplastic [Lolium rigidum]